MEEKIQDRLINGETEIQTIINIKNIDNSDDTKSEKTHTPLMIMKQIISFSLPTIIFFICLTSQATISLIMINAKYKDDENKVNAMKEGMGFAIFIFNLSMLSIIVGLLSGFEILGSAAYGAKKYDLIGVYLWKGRIVGFTIATILLSILFFAFKPLMIACNSSELEIYYGQRFVNFFIFAILFDVLFRSNFVYLNIAEKSFVNSTIVVINLVIFSGVNYLLIYVYDLDTLGAGLSIFIAQGLNAIFTTSYIVYCEPIPNTIFMINRKCFKDLWSYLRISLPSTLLLCAEWWSFELLGFLAILSGCYKEHVVVYNIYAILCSFISGFATSTTIMCSSAMGEKNHAKAKRLFKYNYLFTLCFQSFIGALFAILNKHIVYFFTNEEEQITKIQKTLYIISLLTVLDATQYIVNCFAKSCGKFCITSTICISVLYGIQILCAFVFSYVFKWGLEGIWLASLISLVILEVCYFIIIYCIDFEKAVKEIEFNLDHDKQKLDSLLREEEEKIEYNSHLLN